MPVHESQARADLSLDRRNFLKLGLAGSAALTTVSLTATLTGCGAREQALAQGYRFLRDADLTLFRALTPVVLEGITVDAATMTECLKRLDDMGALAGTPAQAEIYKLFDLLHLGFTRWLTTGVRASWIEASPEEIKRFLERWRTSSVGAFNAGYRLLVKMVAVPYYTQPIGSKQAGYPGPLDWVYKAVNA